MKNVISLLLCCVLAVSLSGCGKSAKEKEEEAARDRYEKAWRAQAEKEKEAYKRSLK